MDDSEVLEEEEYIDSAFDWSFVELSERVKELLDEDDIRSRFNQKKMSEMMRANSINALVGPTASGSMIDELSPFWKTTEKWTFDIFNANYITGGHAMQAVAQEIFRNHDLINKYNLTSMQFLRFINQVERHYRMNPYHNASHATDVLQTVHCIVANTGFIDVMNDLEKFCILLTALVHDIEHTGTNNNFHKNSGSELAKLYVVSVLENHHLRVGMKMLNEFEMLKALSAEEYREFKYMLTSMILSTDMANHFLLITNMKIMLLSPNKCSSRIRIQRIMMLILHAADISNPAKPWDLHKVWVSLLTEEFFLQGDKEREMHLPVSPNCDRNTANIATSQIGFMQTFTEETFDVVDGLIQKELTSASLPYTFYRPWKEHMMCNISKWNGKWKFLKYEQINDLLTETAKPRASIMTTESKISDVQEESEGRQCKFWCCCSEKSDRYTI